MPYYPTVEETYTTREVVDTFGGYNHNMKIGDGEFYNMKNLSGDAYPLLSNRPKRGTVTTLSEPLGLLGKSQLAYLNGSQLYYGGLNLTSYLTAAGFSISTLDSMLPKQLVSMGAYIVIYPDKLYINTENYTDCGCLEARFNTVEGSAVTYTICKADGTAYDTPSVGAIAPETPGNGALWIDTYSTPHVLKQYSEATETWVEIVTVYTKIGYVGIGRQFAKYDGVFISGCASDDTAIADQIAALNGSQIIYDCGDDYIVVIGLLDKAYIQGGGSVTVARTMPDVDFITEAENRLWGCKYGLVNGETVNEIYCCALGDFKNWNRFLGVSTDSYVASVGTDGPWTGAVTHLGYPIFFKEHCMHKVYISSTGAHQIVDTACRGVQRGSHNSLAVVNETLYYKSVKDIVAYDGSLPVSVSDALGTERYYEASAGALGDKYYVSMRDEQERWHLFVLDTLRGFWHREDDTAALRFARCGGELYYLERDSGALKCVCCSEGDAEGDIEWMAETGLMGYATVEQKYISRFNLRMKLPEGSKMDVYIEYDSDNDWQHAGHIKGMGTKTFMLPVRPRRCDHFRIRLVGSGEVRIYTFAKEMEKGSDELWP